MHRRLHFVGPLLLACFLATAWAPAHAQSFWGLTKKKTKPNTFKIVELTLRGGYPDVSPEFSLFEQKQSYKSLVQKLRKIENDASVKAVLFRISGLAVGMAKAVGISQAIQQLSNAGKRTYALLETSSTTDYMVALGCQSVSMVPGGMLYLPGVRIESLYYKNLLARLGLEGDFVTIGAFKTAPEPFMREKMSDAARKQLNRLVGDMYGYMVETIAAHRRVTTDKAPRGMTQDEVKAAIDQGLHSGVTAKKFHLVDHVLSHAGLRKLVKKEVPTRPLQVVTNYGKSKRQAPTSIFSLFSMLMESKKKKIDPNKPKIAVIYAQGPIYYGSPSPGWGNSESEIWSDSMVKTINKVSKLKNLRAVVLRVNSPGGDALASDIIWKRLERLKQRVPLFVSMGNVAASGGYYIAMGADVLLAQPTTITGSIGVFGGKLVMKQTMNKIGVNVQTVSRGKHSGIFSQFSKFSDSERATLKKMLDRVYDTFTKKAAKGRKMTQKQLLAYAGGQVWTGRQAKQAKLIDRLGGLQDALLLAHKRTNLKPGKASVVTYPRPMSFFERLQSVSSVGQPQRLPYAYQQLLQTIMGIAMPQLHRMRLLLQPQRSIFLWQPTPRIRW